MPTTTAAAKALRQNIKHRARNTAVKAAIKKMTVSLRKAYAANSLDQAKTITHQLIKSWDKAAQHNVVSRNTASRKKSRLLHRLHRTKV